MNMLCIVSRRSDEVPFKGPGFRQLKQQASDLQLEDVFHGVPVIDVFTNTHSQAKYTLLLNLEIKVDFPYNHSPHTKAFCLITTNQNFPLIFSLLYKSQNHSKPR